MESNKCPVCKQDGALLQLPDNGYDGYLVKCPRCGKYKITNSLIVEFEQKVSGKNYIVSALLREAFENKQPLIELATYNIEEFILDALVPTFLTEKLYKILLYVFKKTNIVGSYIKISPNDYPIIFAVNKEEFLHMIRLLKEMGYLEIPHDTNEGNWISEISVRLGVKGWEKVEDLMQKNPVTGNQCFVAMWLDDSMKDAWENGFKPGIEEAKYKPIKIDMVPHNEQITDRIISEIRQSRIMVADFSGQRGGVYFEAGFAMGLKKPVIWSCQKKYIKKCHFDTRQYNHIVWEKPDDLREQLTDRILATVPLI